MSKHGRMEVWKQHPSTSGDALAPETLISLNFPLDPHKTTLYPLYTYSRILKCDNILNETVVGTSTRSINIKRIEKVSVLVCTLKFRIRNGN